MGAEESQPQQEPLIPQDLNQPDEQNNISNGPINVPQKQALESKEPPPNAAQTDSKPQYTQEPEPEPNTEPEPQTKPVKEPEPVQQQPPTSNTTEETPKQPQVEEKQPPATDTAQTTQTTNPYIDGNLTKAQTEYSPQKNKDFEEKHQIQSETTQETETETQTQTETQPQTSSNAQSQTQTESNPKPPKILKKATKKASNPLKAPPQSTYEPEKAPMDVKQQIEEYFHTSYPIHITEDVFNTKSDLIRLRRYFHANPELSWEEIETGKNIANYCESLGLATKKGVGKTGVVAVLHGAHSDGLCIALRADMDALPIDEENNHIAYKSRVSGVSHACGHDCHMAILLTVARILSQPKYVKRLHGCVKFIFQPAEEGGAGAKYMIEDGVLKADIDTLYCPEVDEVYGLHVWSYVKLGKIVLKTGALMAGSQRFVINVRGVGGHGAEPKGTSDTVLAITQLSIQLHSIVSRSLSPIECGVLTIGTMDVGDAGNIIAESGNISGTIRYLDNDVFDVMKGRMDEICRGIETGYGVKVSVVWGKNPYPPVINDVERVVNVKNAVNKVFPIAENVMIDDSTTMAAEDFSFYLNEKPGCFFFVGCGVDENEGDENKENMLNNAPQKVLRNIEDGDEKKVKIYAHHTPKFRVDERCLIVGVQIMVNLVMDLLIKSKVMEESQDVEEKGTEDEKDEVIEDKIIGDNESPLDLT